MGHSKKLRLNLNNLIAEPRIFFSWFCWRNLVLLKACAALSCLSCTTSSPTYDGYINDDFISFLNELDRGEDRIFVTSSGGKANAAYLSAKIIYNRKIKITVQIECFSACAEDIITATQELTLYNSPMIGFHWNSFMNFDQLERFGGNVQLCDTSSRDRQFEIYAMNSLNTEFWKETEERLVLKDYKLIKFTTRCAKKNREFENRMWLPNSAQLKNLLGLEFTGNVCSDSFEYCSKKVDKRWAKGERIIIGDRVHVSKG